MAVFFRINARDLSPYVRVQHEDGLDPAQPYSEPQFVGSAFTEGQRFAADSLGNREMVVPLILDAANRAALHTLIADIENELDRGARVEFATDSADSATFFDLERGRLDLEYQYFLSVHSTLRATLHLWVRPFAHTGSARLVASVGQVSGSPIGGALRILPATGLLGDTPALTRLGVRVGSTVASSGRVIAYGAHKSASYNPYRGPSGWANASAADFMPQASTTLSGASGRLGSQMLKIPVSPTGASGIAARVYLSPFEAHQGRSRIYGVVSNGLTAPMNMWAKDRFGALCGPTQQATQLDAGRFQLIDLGEVQVQAYASGIGVPSQHIDLYAGGGAGVGVAASPALRLDALMFQPLGLAPGLLRTAGAGGVNTLYSDGFTRMVHGQFLEGYPAAEVGNADWAQISGGAGVNWPFAGPGFPYRIHPMGGKLGGGGAGGDTPSFAANASMFYSLASGAQNTDVIARVEVGLSNAASGVGSAQAASAAWELWGKQINASQGIFARFELSPTPLLRILAATGGATVMLASANVGTLATGGFIGQALTLGMFTLGPTIGAWVGTNPDGLGAASVGANSVMAAANGWPALRGNQGSNIASCVAYFDTFSYSSLSGGASDITSREFFRIEAWPERRVYQGNASVYLGEQAAAFRGQHPQLQQTGSPVASSGGRLVVFSGALDNFVGNDPIDVEVEALERFTFLR